MWRVDMHIHTYHSFDSQTSPQQLVEACLRAGLNAIAVTDHNTIAGALEVREMASFPVIIGEEIKTEQGEIIGLFLTEEVPRGLPPLEAVDRVHHQGGLVSLPHPFDRFRRSVLTAAGLEAVLPHADIIESFNARNLRQRDNRAAAHLAQRLTIPSVAVSDAHTPGEIGNGFVVMPEFNGSPQGFKAALAQATLVGHPAGVLPHLSSTWAKVRRRLARR